MKSCAKPVTYPGATRAYACAKPARHEGHCCPSAPEVVAAFIADKRPLPELPPRELSPDEWHLRAMLQLAVPLWVQRFQDERKTLADVLEVAAHAGQVVASQGDALMFRTKARPAAMVGSPPAKRDAAYGTAGVFNALAAGLAAASFVPGGARAYGVHWESKPEWLEGA